MFLPFAKIKKVVRILLVEDDTTIAKNISDFLEKDGFQVDSENLGDQGLFRAETEEYDAIILDWMLPDISGIEICSKIRKNGNTSPILLLTAKSQIEDKVQGLDVGADDYLTKPFSLKELGARLRALVRRKNGPSVSPIIKVKSLEVNTNSHEVKNFGKTLLLAPKEYALLEYFAQNPGVAFDRTTLMSHVWGEDIDPFSNTVDVHIRYLRQKLNDSKGTLIATVKGKGYMLCP